MLRPRRARLKQLTGAVPGLLLGGYLALAIGVLLGLVVDTSALVETSGYVFGAALLLAIGLYGSTYGIDLKALRADLRGVVAAVTLGVVLKAAMIAGTMMAVFQRPEALVLGLAVAQIDPLSVAALGKSGRMSQRARSLLEAWASFDDPMTVLLTLYLAGYAYTAAGHSGSPTATGGQLTGLALSALLLVCLLPLWWLGRRLAARVPETPSTQRAKGVVAVLVVLAMLLLAAAHQLMLAVALAGLVVRSRALGRALDRAVAGAFIAAFLALGLLLAQGVAWWPGLVLGVAAFGSQMVVAFAVMPLFVRGLDRSDRVALGFGQQNGITAVLIALTLERDFPATIATVGPAIVTVNVLHGVSQAFLAHPLRLRRPAGPRVRMPRIGAIRSRWGQRTPGQQSVEEEGADERSTARR
ncbi:cation:proton antiporter [Streptomyces sp. NPDC006879]|uniref:cation:proton antiporter domain-containing protein n=1 Tax=Streptomyces sp. NPDC006879 TaxID=3364767 RepID=UPI0036B4B0F5